MPDRDKRSNWRRGPSSNGTGGWHEVAPDRPCPICGKPDQCGLSNDGGACACYRVSAGGQEKNAKDGRTFWVHRLNGTNGFRPPAQQPTCTQEGAAKGSDDDLNRVYSAFLANLYLSRHAKDLTGRGPDGPAGKRTREGRLPHTALEGRSGAVQRMIADCPGLEQLLPGTPGFYVKEKAVAVGGQLEEARGWCFRPAIHRGVSSVCSPGRITRPTQRASIAG